MIHRTMKIEDILRNHPETIPVFERFGIDCGSCQLSEFEDLEHGARAHGIDVEALLAELNERVRG